MNGAKKKQNSVVGGVAMLTLAGLMVKVTGMMYKIPLTYLLGDEGMGYFNAAYTVYSWLYMLSTSGFPIAVSILVSEALSKGRCGEVRRIVRTTGTALFFIGTVGTLGMLIFARPLADFVGSPNSAASIRAIAPALFLICITSLFRGYFQGHRNMAPTAISQVLESVGKVALGILLAYLGYRRGDSLYAISALAITGVSLGTCVGTVYLVLRYFIGKKSGEYENEGEVGEDTPQKGLWKRLLSIALPVTLGASVMSLTTLIDLGMMIRRLQDVGYSQPEATALYGNYTTLVVPMFNLPTILISPIASGIIPALSSAYAVNNKKEVELIEKNAYRMVAAIGIPCSLGLCFLARPILGLLYPPSSVETAYSLLSTVSPAVYFLCILTVTNAVLQSTGSQKASMAAMGIGAFFKIGVGYLLMGNEKFGIYGAPLGTVVCYGVAAVIALAALVGKTGYLVPPGDLLIKPLIAALCGVGSATFAYKEILYVLGRVWGIGICLLLSVFLYGLCAFALGIISWKDMAPLMPFAGKGRKQKKAAKYFQS